MKSILLVKKLSGLVERTSGLVNGSFSLPKWQAVKMIFFAPCHVFPNTATVAGHVIITLEKSYRKNSCISRTRV